MGPRALRTDLTTCSLAARWLFPCWILWLPPVTLGVTGIAGPCSETCLLSGFFLPPALPSGPPCWLSLLAWPFLCISLVSFYTHSRGVLGRVHASQCREQAHLSHIDPSSCFLFSRLRTPTKLPVHWAVRAQLPPCLPAPGLPGGLRVPDFLSPRLPWARPFPASHMENLAVAGGGVQ